MHAQPLHPQLQLLVEASRLIQAPLCLADAHGQAVYLNQAFLALTGFPSLEALAGYGRIQQLFTGPEATVWAQVQNGQTWQGMVQLPTHANHRHSLSLNVAPLEDEAQRFIGYLIISTTTPTTTLADNDKHILLESFVAHANDAVMITEAAPLEEPGPRIVYVNSAFTRITHYSAEEAIGRSPRFLQGPKTDRQQLNHIRHALLQQTTLKVELINYKKSGEEFWVSFSLVPVSTNGKTITHYVSIQREVTARKKAEQALLESRQQLQQALRTNQQILQHSVDVICTIDQEGKFVQLSPACTNVWGYTPEELVGRYFVDFVVPEDKAKSLAVARQLVTAGQILDFENRYRHKQGHSVPMMWAGSWSEEDQLIYTTARDISERKEAEQRLQKSEQLYRTVVEHFPNGTIGIVEQDFTFSFIAGLGLAKAGFTPADFIGKSFSELLTPEVAAEVLRALAPTFQGISCSKEFSAHGLDFVAHTVPLYDHGTVSNFLMVSQDITGQKEAEEKLKRYTEQLEKINGELDQFVYKTSHDLRAPLVSLLGLINLSRTTTTLEERDEFLRLMEKSVRKLDSFIHEIIDYSRSARSEIQAQEINFPQLVQEAIEHLQYMEAAGTIRIRTELPKTSSFRSDQKRLEVILNNLLSNAIRYYDPRKAVPYIHIKVKPDKKKGIVLQIEDNGLGIATEHQPKVYEMFYRATDTNVGSGLGLYIVRENINRLGGTISMTSALGLGTTFTIQLPSLSPTVPTSH